MLKKIIKTLFTINIKTIYFNFKYLPFKQACKLPILLYNGIYLKKTNGKIIIDSPIKFGMIKIGNGDVGIFDKVKSRSIWQVSGTVIFKGKASFGHGSKISVSGTLIIGNSFILTAESSIVCHKKIEFGKNVLLSWEILLMDSDLHCIKSFQNNEILNHNREIIIGDNVWIGCRVTVLKGSVIPNNSIIGTGSIVNKELYQENSIFAGQPVRLLKENVYWDY